MACNPWGVSSKREQQEVAGRWLRQARERRGFATVGALARRLGVSESLVSRYETGLSSISDERAEQIADALGMGIMEVRRGLGLWVPDGPVEGRDLESMNLDELVAMAEGLLDQIEAKLPPRKRPPVRLSKETIKSTVSDPPSDVDHS